MRLHETRPVLASGELAAGERVLWSGRPDPLTSLAERSVLALIALAWLAGSGFMTSEMIEHGRLPTVIFMLLFVGVGIYMLVTAFMAYPEALRTTVFITDRRLLIVRKKGASTTSILLGAIRQVERINKRRGITLRVPMAVVTDNDGKKEVEYIDLHALQDGERAFQLLTRQAA